jgi:hypothetical protein
MMLDQAEASPSRTAYLNLRLQVVRALDRLFASLAPLPKAAAWTRSPC